VKKVKSWLALWVKRFLYRSGLDRLKRRFFPAPFPVIVRYHSICSDSRLISAGIRITPEAFEEQLAYFSKYFCVLTMDQLLEHIQSREAFPQNALVLTFDDGYADNLNAAKRLKAYGLSGLFYITAGCIETGEAFWVAEVRHLIENTSKKNFVLPLPEGKCIVPLSSASERELAVKKVTRLFKSVTIETREDIRKGLRLSLDDVPHFPGDLMLAWSDLEEMLKLGMEIGGHTMTHPNLPSATQDEARREIFECKSLLEQQLKTKVNHFAYPNGGSAAHYDEKTKALVAKAGFLSASTSRPGRPCFESDLFELRRMRVTENFSEMLWEL